MRNRLNEAHFNEIEGLSMMNRFTMWTPGLETTFPGAP
jgi:hypothetical protein